jgi:hypothetical protein
MYGQYSAAKGRQQPQPAMQATCADPSQHRADIAAKGKTGAITQ